MHTWYTYHKQRAYITAEPEQRVGGGKESEKVKKEKQKRPRTSLFFIYPQKRIVAKYTKSVHVKYEIVSRTSKRTNERYKLRNMIHMHNKCSYYKLQSKWSEDHEFDSCGYMERWLFCFFFFFCSCSMRAVVVVLYNIATCFQVVFPFCRHFSFHFYPFRLSLLLLYVPFRKNFSKRSNGIESQRWLRKRVPVPNPKTVPPVDSKWLISKYMLPTLSHTSSYFSTKCFGFICVAKTMIYYGSYRFELYFLIRFCCSYVLCT